MCVREDLPDKCENDSRERKVLQLTFFDDCSKEWELLEFADIRDHPGIVHLGIQFLLKAKHDVPTTAQLPEDIRKSSRRRISTSNPIRNVKEISAH